MNFSRTCSRYGLTARWSELHSTHTRLKVLTSNMVKGVMVTGSTLEIDFIEELQMRRWARENYVPQPERDRQWHPIIHDEMGRKDHEGPTVFHVPARN